MEVGPLVGSAGEVLGRRRTVFVLRFVLSATVKRVKGMFLGERKGMLALVLFVLHVRNEMARCGGGVVRVLCFGSRTR